MEIQGPQLLDAKAPPRKKVPNKFIKSFACIVLFTAFAIYRFTFPAIGDTCIKDAYHDATIALNRGLVQDPGPAFQGNGNQLTTFGKAFIGIGQVLMDLWVLAFAGIWIVNTKNMRGFAGIALFYLIRGTIFLNVMKFPYPANLAWRSPGFFSATVPYDHTRDFFFSGHCGGLTVIMSEMFTLRLWKTGALALISLLYMANMLMATEVHYSIDIVAGILFGLWFYRFATRYTSFFDYILSLPLVGWQKLSAHFKCMADQGAEVGSETGGSEAAASDQQQKGKVESKEGLQQQMMNKQVLHQQEIEEQA